MRKNSKQINNEQAARDLYATLASLQTTLETREFLEALLTPAERKRLVLRWRLVRLLAAGMTQRDIAARLKVSLCKITRGSRELKYGPPIFRALAQKNMGQSR